MPEKTRSEYESAELRAVRPYLIVSDAKAAIEFYRRVFDAKELERHTTPSGGIGHAKLQLGETIIELGEHPDAARRSPERLPRVGLRLYVGDVDATYGRAMSEGATPSPRPTRRISRAAASDPSFVYRETFIETAGRKFEWHNFVEPGGGPIDTPHVHLHNRETFRVIDGEIRFVIDGEEHVAAQPTWSPDSSRRNTTTTADGRTEPGEAVGGRIHERRFQREGKACADHRRHRRDRCCLCRGVRAGGGGGDDR